MEPDYMSDSMIIGQSKADNSFHNHSAKFSSGKSASPCLAIIALLHIFQFGQDIFGNKPTATKIESADIQVFSGTFSHLAIYCIVPSTYVELFICTKPIKKFSGKLCEAPFSI